MIAVIASIIFLIIFYFILHKFMYNARKIVNERSAEAYNQNISAISNLSQNKNNLLILTKYL